MYSVHGGGDVCGIGRVKEGSAREGKRRERVCVCLCESERARDWSNLGKLWLLNFLEDTVLRRVPSNFVSQLFESPILGT